MTKIEGSSQQMLELQKIRDVRGPQTGPNVEKVQGPKGEEFSKVLTEQIDGPAKNPAKNPAETLKFSAHAQKRMDSRSIDLSPDDFIKMQEAVQRAREKGSKESLILTDKAAFVVSVKNNTVITAVDKASLKENVFTNIDSTIMI